MNEDKKSLFWRLVLIILVLACWTWALIPINDKVYFETAVKLVKNSDARYEEILDRAKKYIAESDKTYPMSEELAVLKAANTSHLQIALDDAHILNNKVKAWVDKNEGDPA
ncbi:MAG: hypothetical protein HRT89_22255, partial [Lentisphaeria bacterium]|nr:hypothetical protein [Lentisphaeria bacterium]NQZ70782.1 hypothetical protein [Lentisphaeria bacterium]